MARVDVADFAQSNIGARSSTQSRSLARINAITSFSLLVMPVVIVPVSTNSVNSSGKKARLIRRRPPLSHLTRGQSAERHQLAVLRVPQRQPRAFQAPKQGQPWRGLKHRIVDMAFAQPVVGDFA